MYTINYYVLAFALSIFSYTAYAQQLEEHQTEHSTEKTEQSMPKWVSPSIKAFSIACASSCVSIMTGSAMGLIKPKGVSPAITGITFLASFVVGVGATYSHEKQHYMVIITRCIGSFFGIMFGLSMTNMVVKQRE